VARWEEAYDALIDVYSWWRTPQGRAYGERFGASLSRAEAQEQGLTPGVEAGPLGWDVAHSQELSAFGADPVYVDPDMQTVVDALASKFEPEALRPEDMITEAGFALLPHPVTDVDIHGKTMSWRAVMWYPTPKDPDNVCGHRRPDGTLCPVMGGYHAQILIDAYVKGPADKPLIPRKVRAFEVIK
jgi:hypothetical protein